MKRDRDRNYEQATQQAMDKEGQNKDGQLEREVGTKMTVNNNQLIR